MTPIDDLQYAFTDFADGARSGIRDFFAKAQNDQSPQDQAASGWDGYAPADDKPVNLDVHEVVTQVDEMSYQFDGENFPPKHVYILVSVEDYNKFYKTIEGIVCERIKEGLKDNYANSGQPSEDIQVKIVPDPNRRCDYDIKIDYIDEEVIPGSGVQDARSAGKSNRGGSYGGAKSAGGAGSAGSAAGAGAAAVGAAAGADAGTESFFDGATVKFESAGSTVKLDPDAQAAQQAKQADFGCAPTQVINPPDYDVSAPVSETDMRHTPSFVPPVEEAPSDSPIVTGPFLDGDGKVADSATVTPGATIGVVWNDSYAESPDLRIDSNRSQDTCCHHIQGRFDCTADGEWTFTQVGKNATTVISSGSETLAHKDDVVELHDGDKLVFCGGAKFTFSL